MLMRMWTDTQTLDLQARLSMPLAHVMGHLEALYNRAYEHLPKSGRLKTRDLLFLETWAMWEGKRGLFVNALVKASIILQNKRGNYLALFSANAPDFVRKRWARKQLRLDFGNDPYPKPADNGGQRRPQRKDKDTTDKPRKEMPGTGKPTTAKPDAAPQCSGNDTQPATAKPVVVIGQKDQNGKDLTSSQGVCLVFVERLRKALAEVPPCPSLMLLMASGMKGLVARDLAKAHPAPRVREAAVYASRNADQNPAGLIRSILANPDWILT